MTYLRDADILISRVGATALTRTEFEAGEAHQGLVGEGRGAEGVELKL